MPGSFRSYSNYARRAALFAAQWHLRCGSFLTLVSLFLYHCLQKTSIPETSNMDEFPERKKHENRVRAARKRKKRAEEKQKKQNQALQLQYAQQQLHQVSSMALQLTAPYHQLHQFAGMAFQNTAPYQQNLPPQIQLPPPPPPPPVAAMPGANKERFHGPANFEASTVQQPYNAIGPPALLFPGQQQQQQQNFLFQQLSMPPPAHQPVLDNRQLTLLREEREHQREFDREERERQREFERQERKRQYEFEREERAHELRMRELELAQSASAASFAPVQQNTSEMLHHASTITQQHPTAPSDAHTTEDPASSLAPCDAAKDCTKDQSPSPQLPLKRPYQEISERETREEEERVAREKEACKKIRMAEAKERKEIRKVEIQMDGKCISEATIVRGSPKTTIGNLAFGAHIQQFLLFLFCSRSTFAVKPCQRIIVSACSGRRRRDAPRCNTL